MKPLFQFLGLCLVLLVAIFAYFVFGNPIRNIGGPSAASIEQMVSAQQHEVIMYSLTTCGYCTAKRREFKRYGAKFTEYFLDKDRAVVQSVSRKLATQGYRNGNIGTPLFEINGKMITGNPPIETLAQYW